MSCTLAHSRTEWYSWPPVKRFGVGKALRGEHCAVRPSARDREPGLDARPADGLEGRLDHTRGLVDVRPHVAIRVPLLDLDVGARLACGDLGGKIAQKLDMRLEQIVVVVTRDEVDDRLFRASGDAVRVDVALPILRRLGRQPVRGKRADELGGELDGIHELALRRPGVHREPANRHSHGRRRERLGLELSERRSVEGVRDVRAEGVEVEVLRAPADLLVDGERDTDRSSVPLGMPHEVHKRTHDLRDPGLVVRP